MPAKSEEPPELTHPIMSKLELAEHQLDRAILLFLDERDYICAITLAGAADELLRELLEAEGKVPWLEAFVELAMQVGDHSNDKTMRKLLIKFANHHRNELKHLIDGDALQVLPGDAQAMLERGISNFMDLTGRQTPTILRYMTEMVDA